MARILLLLVIVFLLYLLFRGLFRSQVGKRPTDAPKIGEDMVICVRCGVNQPRSETRDLEGQVVCANNPQCH